MLLAASVAAPAVLRSLFVLQHNLPASRAFWRLHCTHCVHTRIISPPLATASVCDVQAHVQYRFSAASTALHPTWARARPGQHHQQQQQHLHLHQLLLVAL
jgi:hypothetical protein